MRKTPMTTPRKLTMFMERSALAEVRLQQSRG